MTSVSNELVLCGLSDKSSMYDVKQVFRRFGHIARFILLSENVESNQSVAILKYKSNESTKDALKHWSREKLYLNNNLINVRAASEFNSLLNPETIPAFADRRLLKRQRSTSNDRLKHDTKRHDQPGENHNKIRSDNSNYNNSSSRSKSRNNQETPRYKESQSKARHDSVKKEYSATDRGSNSRPSRQSRFSPARSDDPEKSNDQRLRQSSKETYDKNNHSVSNSSKFERHSFKNSEVKVKTENTSYKETDDGSRSKCSKENSYHMNDQLKKKLLYSSDILKPKTEPFKEISNNLYYKSSKETESEKYSFNKCQSDNLLPKIYSPKPFNKENSSNRYKKPRYGETEKTAAERSSTQEFFSSTVIRSPSPSKVDLYTRNNLDRTWSSEEPSPCKEQARLRDDSFHLVTGSLEDNN